MSVLAIDSASRARVWVLLTTSDGSVIERRDVPGGELDRRLPAALAELLCTEITAVVVLTGPGSYSGVRAGMATALGLAAARNLPVHGVGNLTALASVADVADGAVFVAVSDAGRSGVYTAQFRRRGFAVEQLSQVRRESALALGTARVFAATEIDGVAAEQVDPVRVLAAAVPISLALPPLTPLGLRATHAESVGNGSLPPGERTLKAL